MFTSVNDIFDRLGVICDGRIEIDKWNIEKLDYFEKLVYDNLSYETKHLDELILSTKLTIEKCLNVLISLQLNGYVECTRVNYYKLV